MSNISIDPRSGVMKRVIMAALLAVFLSLIVSGCYTKLKRPEPSTGDRYYGDYYNNDYRDYYGYWGSYFYYNGWYSPYFYTYPYYYGYFNRPWYYDPWWWNYYGGDGGRRSSGKSMRRGRGDTDLPPSPGYTPPSQPSSGGQGYQTPPPSPPSGGNARPNTDSGNDSGKSTRRRR
jgi:hypothetical protein